MHNKHFILHLTLIEDIGPAIIQPIIKRSDVSASDLYLFSQIDWMNVFGFTENSAEKLVAGLANKKILEEELALIEQHKIQWVTFEDETYPYLLKQIYLPPAVIYMQGLLSSARPDTSAGSVVNAACPQKPWRRRVEGYPRAPQNKNVNKLLAIVGARKANNYGQRVVDQLVPDLIAAQYSIVSGGALGIDTMAHEATIKNGGKTIAVLGSGLLQPYPSANKKLFASIVESGGCIVSSFPLRMEALPGHFPARNRIISGLSHGCLVVQAAQKSGALITAHYALEQGREVFAVPGPIGDELSVGCNTLIQSGAKLVMSSADIFNEFGDRVIIPNLKPGLRSFNEVGQLSLEATVIPAKKIEKIDVSSEALAKEDKYINYSAQQRIIIAACKQSASLDDIITSTQFASEVVQSELFNLQLDGVVEQDFTGVWGLVR